MVKFFTRAVKRVALQCEATLWDAKQFTAMMRPRLFWGNLPGMHWYTIYVV